MVSIIRQAAQAVGIREFLRDLAGGDTVADAFRERRCIKPQLGCGQRVRTFRDVESRREWTITGFCQDCQDRVESMLEDCE